MSYNLTFCLLGFDSPDSPGCIFNGCTWAITGVAGSWPNLWGGHDPIVMSVSQTWAVQTLNQHIHTILLSRMLPCAGRGLIRCEWTLGTRDMYCYDTLSTNTVLWLLTSSKLGGFWSSKVMSHQVRFLYKVPFKKCSITLRGQQGKG